MKIKRDALGDRIKENYENRAKTFLTRRVPVIIRLDGKAFHTFTKGMKKPFDDIMVNTMQKTTKYLCENIQGCVFGYTQSDEITLILTDYKTIKTDAWFGYNVQKMTSISASMATLAFNKYFRKSYKALRENLNLAWNVTDEEYEYLEIISKKLNKAMFDSRVFSIPKEEVCNCLIWRQQDATRNSIESVGQANFSSKELHKKNCDQIQEMLFTQKGINWNDYPTDYKRGACCYKIKKTEVIFQPKLNQNVEVERNKWVIDKEIPIFTQDRTYIEKWL